MCGIASIFSKSGHLELHTFRAILDSIKHRGYSGYNNETFVDPKNSFAIGANRLPIVKARQNTQPVVSINRNLLLVMNAEIFNYEELAIKLLNYQEKDIPGDTKVLADLLENFPIETVLSHIRWEGCFICINKKSNTAILCRDHLGIKPLYYAHTEESFYLCSEIKGLTSTISETVEINHIEPGCYYSLDITTHMLKKFKWWLPCPGNKTELDFLIRRSIEERVPKEKYGVLLSGGLDSSVVLSTARQINSNVIAFTLANKESEDIKYARELCSSLDVELTEVSAPIPSDLYKNIKSTIRHVESWEWQVVNHSAPMDPLFRTVYSKGIKVVLTGEGADELFYGYSDVSNKKYDINQIRLNRLTDLHRTNCRRLDRMGMAYSVECRVPFLDKDLINCALGFSHSDCVDGSRNKIPLRDWARAILPKHFCDRPKISLAKGVGYQYGTGMSEAGVFGQIPGLKDKAELSELFKFPIEEIFYETAKELGYLRAKYLQSRSAI